jgi:phospholipid/cholesterol/gamma-HCH transport system substrate-binding protein
MVNNRVCENGYQSTTHRPPQDGSVRTMNLNARCAEPITQSDARGSQNAPRAPIATYNRTTGQVTWGASTSSGAAGDWTSWGWSYGFPTGGH